MHELDQESLLAAYGRMLHIRNFELRAESAYQKGKVGGFFHAYIGQEAIQTACVDAIGIEGNYWITTYRCHALALLLGASAQELMAELYGKIEGNAKGRGGSMHMYTDHMLGGFGIVGGQCPVAAGAAFALKYLEQPGVAVCFLGDGAVPQGAFHESMNLAALWDLPCIYVIENNIWGMGTHYRRANAVEKLAQSHAKAYGMESYTLNGLDYRTLYTAFSEIKHKVLATSRPVLVEVLTERFRGHSISDPGLYRTKDELKEVMTRDPVRFLLQVLLDAGYLDEAQSKIMDKESKKQMIDAMEYAEHGSEPDPDTLGKDVFAP